MNGRRDDDRGRRPGDRELRRGQAEEYQAGRRGEYERDRQRDWDEHGYERGPERRGVSDRDVRSMAENVRRSFRHEVPEEDRDLRRADQEEETDSVHPSRDFEWDRDYRTMEGDRERRDYEMDRDFGRAARELDRAREYGRDFNRDRELDRRARDFDPERIARRPGYSPSGNYRALQDEVREERERPRRLGDRLRSTSPQGDTDRYGSGTYDLDARGRQGGDVGRSDAERGRYGQGTREPRDTRRFVGRDLGYSERGMRRGTDRVAEEDTRFGGTEPGGHGPGVENMAPPSVGYSTSPSRRDDHEMGHGGYMGGTSRSTTPTSRPTATGRGPRSYQRGDDRIRADLCDKLMQGWMNAEDVDVKVQDGLVTLSGTVRSRDEKRAIEDLAEEVLGVKEVTNNIRLNRAEGALHRQASQEPVQQPGADTGDDRGLHS
jgi:hypothetical protein